MNYAELSLEKLKEISIGEADKICKKEKINLIVFIAKAGFPIAFFMKDILNCPILGIDAQRSGNNIKTKLGSLISNMPKLVRDIFITLELKLKVHKKDTERHVVFHDSLKNIDKADVKHILLVDDSVDTGYSVTAAIKCIQKEFPYARVTTYSLNVWDESEQLVKIDYFSYVNTAIRAPMSKDSKEYKRFCNMYNQVTQNGFI